MDMREALLRLVDQRDFSTEEMAEIMRLIMTGEADDAQIGAFLMALRIKGETIDEVTGAVMVMRELARGVEVGGDHLVDIVGTGGDGANLFNVSTASTFVAAAAGARVAKHGNRSVSSNSGSADLLEAAGVRLDLSAEQVQTCVERLGVGFMFAPMHHSAMRHAIGPRKALGLRTLFNILGPMTNPAGVKRMVIGVYDPALCRPVAEVLSRLNADHVLVLHAHDGLDEISLAAPTHVVQWQEGRFREFDIVPEDLGVATRSLEGLEVEGAEDSLRLIREALGPAEQRSDTGDKAVDILCLNAGAALFAAGVAENLIDGAARARKVIENGEALHKLEALATLSQEL